MTSIALLAKLSFFDDQFPVVDEPSHLVIQTNSSNRKASSTHLDDVYW